ncbi:uncharacterized protein BCR38DRAFT_516526 [Pseudomassariella vexata]|uniref:F-box domain-containing protein n=1 Tax=Pseudomassariella vexata TaxID=1141098 RepID=A0A1Y2DVV0_9PEZI|nr:uncharacterized protein BCR38DRAFT_516526 [Pseudomassariella vexata]ORY63319.1 hypothetical protein BCR38DRAFT_516526 [Pseudomassariella vexata]
MPITQMNARSIPIPTEVWVIVGNLRDTGKGATLSSVAQSCKFLSHVVQPILYESPTGIDHRPRILFRNCYNIFFRTVATNKRLASFVRNINARRWEDDRLDNGWELLQCVARQIGMERGVAQEMEAHIEDAIRAMERFKHDPHLRHLLPNLRSMQLLPCLLPNLRDLSIELNLSFDVLHSIVVCTAKSPSIMFPSLERLEISVCELNRGFDIDHVRYLLKQCPNLAHLKLTGCSGLWQPKNPNPDDPNLERFEHLTILAVDYGYISSDDFARLFRLCPRLESFSYSSGGYEVLGRGDDNPEVLSVEVIDLLRPAQYTLKRLKLDFRFSTNVVLNWNADRADIISRLQGFYVLQAAELDGESLLEGQSSNNHKSLLDRRHL